MIPTASTPELARNYAERAVIYGLPLVLMEQTRQTTSANISRLTGEPARANVFRHVRQLANSKSRTVIRPNNDTLYSGAWLDLSQGPVRLEVPAIRDRYWIMPLMDAWTNVFAAVGSRTHADQVSSSGAYWWITNAKHRASLPAGSNIIESPTDMVWMIGRIELRGTDDLPAVHAIQDGFKLGPAVAARNVPATVDARLPPIALREMTAIEFLNRLAALMAEQTPLPQDALPVGLLAALGVNAGQPFPGANSSRSPEWLQALEEGKRNAFEALAQAGLSRRDPKTTVQSNGWNLNNMPAIGRFGSEYGLRSAIALSGLGALPLDDAWYPATDFDAQGQRFSGAYRYRMHFSKDQLPPARAFWSVTMYDADGYFIDAPNNRYALTDRDPLHFNEDGSLTLIISARPPASAAEQRNWLPAPEGAFNLTMRLYDPAKGVAAGGWMPPKVERLEPIRQPQ